MTVKAISTNIGKALLINALFMLISILVAVFNGMDSGFTPMVISFLVTVITGIFPFIFVKDKPSTTLHSGYLTIVFSWILSFMFGMLPYVLWGGEFTLANAWFESVSGYTTTGSTILTDIEALPKSLLFWRSSTHFIGGLGVIVFLLMVLPDSNPFKLRLTNLELSSLSKEGYRYKSGKTARVMVSVYICLTIAETLCLWAAGMTLFDAVNHAFSTVATGGFSTKNASVMHFDSAAIDIIITVFMALSSLHFGVLFAVVAKRSLKPLRNPISRYYICVIAVFSIIIACSLKIQGGYQTWGKSLLDATFQTVSFISTTGFGQADNAAWPLLANAILLFASFHCGCSGSTTGGIKADRMFISLKAAYGDIQKRLHPTSLFRTKVGGRALDEDTVSSVFLYIVLYIITLFLSFVIVLICGLDIAEAFSGTVASLGNVGPGVGQLGTMGNYASLPAVVKFIFTIDMFLGRVEIFPILIVLSMIRNRK
ncbi:MAG: TrkH family potassium uptake protein [Bacteroidales bacterium]|nr:TrkH family potassium uptake protein [Bacteroidales bacterium]MBO5107236.1 TrkH family potassium uptake protein [Bacteroidales bacterium]